MEHPREPMQGEPSRGTSTTKELQEILDAGALNNNAEITRVRAESMLSVYCAELVYEVKEL